MARHRDSSRSPHLQVGSRLTALCLALALAFSMPAAIAASKKPTPKPTTKVTTKASAKPSAKPTVKTSAKPSTKATPKVSGKPSAKPTVTKKPTVKKKKKVKKKIRITPSPKPVWPPQGFSVEGEVYAKVPTSKELVGLISANTTLSRQIKQCTTYICGSVQVAAENGCIWWEVISDVFDGEGKKLGELTSAFGSSGTREFKTLIVVSPELVENGGAAKIISVICHHEDRIAGSDSVTYKKLS